MNVRYPAIGPILTPDHRMRRFKFAQEHSDWRMCEWESVLFTDESRVHLSTCDVIDVCACVAEAGGEVRRVYLC